MGRIGNPRGLHKSVLEPDPPNWVSKLLGAPPPSPRRLRGGATKPTRDSRRVRRIHLHRSSESHTMDSKQGNQLHRHLAHIKVVSRLLGHELHSQGAGKTIALSRDQVVEIQTSLDLFIEEATRRLSGGSGGSRLVNEEGMKETRLVTARN